MWSEGSVRNKLEWLEMGEVGPGKWQGGHPAHEGSSLCILRLSIVCWKTHQYPQSNSEWERQIVVVQKYTAIPRIEWTRWGTSEVRVENIPRTHHTADPQRNPKLMGELICTPENFLGRIKETWNVFQGGSGEDLVRWHWKQLKTWWDDIGGTIFRSLVSFVSWFSTEFLNCESNSSWVDGTRYSAVWKTSSSWQAQLLGRRQWLFMDTGGVKGAVLWLLGSPSGQRLLDEVGDRTTDCAASVCHPLRQLRCRWDTEADREQFDRRCGWRYHGIRSVMSLGIWVGPILRQMSLRWIASCCHVQGVRKVIGTPQTENGGFGGPICTELCDVEVRSALSGSCASLSLALSLHIGTPVATFWCYVYGGTACLWLESCFPRC